MKLCAVALLAVNGALQFSSAHAEEDGRIFITSEYLTFGSADDQTVAIALTDIDADHDLDMVVINGRHWARQDYIIFNNGAGRFLHAERLGDHLATGYEPALGDFNGDGATDILVARDRIPNRLFLSQGLNFVDGGDVGLAGPTRAVAAGDFNRDGVMDFVASLRGELSYVAYGPDFKRVAKVDGAHGTVRVAVGDLNNDGWPDAAFANFDGAESFVALNDGAGQFGKIQYLGTPTGSAVDVAVGDMDGDGILDLVFARVGANVVIYGDREGSFGGARHFGTDDARSYGLDLADFDLDGRLDVVIANDGTTNAVYMNKANAMIRIDLSEDVVARSYGVTTGDINGDGFPDIVFANSGSLSRIYLNVSNQTADEASKR